MNPNRLSDASKLIRPMYGPEELLTDRRCVGRAFCIFWFSDKTVVLGGGYLPGS